MIKKISGGGKPKLDNDMFIGGVNQPTPIAYYKSDFRVGTASMVAVMICCFLQELSLTAMNSCAFCPLYSIDKGD